MKRIILMLLMLIKILPVNAQNKKLDSIALTNWPVIDRGWISNDGKWCFFKQENVNQMTHRIIKNTLLITSIDKKLKYDYENIETQLFSSDSKFAFFEDVNHNLYILKLGEDKPLVIKDVGSFKTLNINNAIYILYSKIKEPNSFFLREIYSDKEIIFENSKSYYASKSKLYLIKRIEENNFQINCFDLITNEEKEIWTGKEEPKNLIISDDASQVCFSITESLWLIKLGEKKSVEKIEVKNNIEFSKFRFNRVQSIKGRFIEILFYNDATKIESLLKENVSVYSFQDASFRPGQEFSGISMTILYDTERRKTSRLGNNAESVLDITEDGKYAIIGRERDREYYWNNEAIGSLSVENLLNQELTCRIENVNKILSSDNTHCYFSYLNKPDIFSLNFETGRIINITDELPLAGYINPYEQPQTADFYWTLLSVNHANILVSDQYDIWSINNTGKKKITCITGGFGKKNAIQFKLIDKSIKILSKNIKVYLSAYNPITKEAGFYVVNWPQLSDPIKLSIGEYTYENIVKAKDSNIWILKRETLTNSPNYYATSNFKEFKQLSNNNPEKEYLWHTAEHINYKTKQGIDSQLILYKPEDLDSTKKYPVLFTFYEQESVRLNSFLVPGLTDGFRMNYGYTFNIPLMLSKGYLVCVPDIHYKIGQPAKSIVDCIEGAADEIMKRSFVDGDRMGAAGGSFGGYEVNCLAAFSSRFKALVSIAGISDLFSMYGNFPGLKDEEAENRQGRMGTSLSRNPEAYMKNSPIAFAKNVTAPLLIAHGAKDTNVNPQQSYGWLNALRREGKPSWLIWYPKNLHGISGEENVEYDLSKRMTQFYDHYLKGLPGPKWMLESKSVIDRSGKNGFSLDSLKREIGPGLNTVEDLKKRLP